MTSLKATVTDSASNAVLIASGDMLPNGLDLSSIDIVQHPALSVHIQGQGQWPNELQAGLWWNGSYPQICYQTVVPQNYDQTVVTDTVKGPPGDPPVVVIIPVPGMAISKSVDKAVVEPGGVLTYTVVVTNTSGPGLILKNIPVKDPAPLPGATLVAGSVQLNPASAGTAGTDLPDLATVTLDAGQNVTITFQLQLPLDLANGQAFENVATADTPPGVVLPPDHSPPVTSTVQMPALLLSKIVTDTTTGKAGPTQVGLNDTLLYTVLVTNTDQSLTARGVTVTDVLASGLTQPNNITPGSGSFDSTSRTLTWPNLTIPPGSTLALSFVVGLDSKAVTNGETITNTAQVQPPTSDPPGDAVAPPVKVFVPQPTPTPTPTAIPPTSTPVPTATPTPNPTATAVPTSTPGPTSTAVPTGTPAPTSTPRPTSTPGPTSTPAPTATPVPGALHIVKSVRTVLSNRADGQLGAGDTVEYSIVITNPGPGAATGLVFTDGYDYVPPGTNWPNMQGTSFVGLSANAELDPASASGVIPSIDQQPVDGGTTGNIVVKVAELDPNQSLLVRFRVRLSTNEALDIKDGSVRNLAYLTSNQMPPDPANPGQPQKMASNVVQSLLAEDATPIPDTPTPVPTSTPAPTPTVVALVPPAPTATPQPELGKSGSGSSGGLAGGNNYRLLDLSPNTTSMIAVASRAAITPKEVPLVGAAVMAAQVASSEVASTNSDSEAGVKFGLWLFGMLMVGGIIAGGAVLLSKLLNGRGWFKAK